MKKFNKIILSAGLVAMAASFGSCTDDLDLLPTDPNTLTAANFAEDPEGYMDAVMADVYLQFATQGANGSASVEGFDGGMSTFQRSSFILEEVPSDEANWLAADADYGTFQYGIIPANNRVVFGTYSRYYINVTLCNDFIQTVQAGYFHLDTDALKAKADEYIRQCKILRSGCYWYLVDCFGNVPYADESTKTGSVPSQIGRAEVANRVMNTLEEVIAEYEQLGNPTPAYGYVGKAAAQAILVKFLLNAEVYTGTAQWSKCIEVAQKLINEQKGQGFEGSGLCNYYNQLFAANNSLYAIGGGGYCHEILWTIPQDATNLVSWANGTFMVNAWIGETYGCTKAKYNAGDAWKCMTARTQFVEKFEWDDAAMSESKDTRVANWITSADGFSVLNPAFDQDHYGDNGYLPMKFTNFNVDPETGLETPENSPSPTTQLGIDYPVIRLAEIYLSCAEAMFHNGQVTEALNYVNLIRRRAGLDNWSTLSLQDLRDERCRELYTEATRRSDLIRYGQWISGYTWNWKNQIATGGDFASNFTLYPLPSSICVGAGYDQNTGY